MTTTGSQLRAAVLGIALAAKLAKQIAFELTMIVVLAVVPVQLLDQPVKVEPVVATAVRVTDVFCA